MKSNTDSDAPKRAILRTDNVEPMSTTSITDKEEPNREPPNTESFAPKRAKDRRDMDEPIMV
jgi:hypothetical protein